MATNVGLKFIKTQHYSGETLSANWATNLQKEGALIYATDSHELWIGGSTPVCVVKGTTDVTYNSGNSKLTIKTSSPNAAESVQVLDFSDVASSSGAIAMFAQVYGLMGATETGGHEALDYSGTNYLANLGTEGNPAKNLVNADKKLDAEIKRVSDAIGEGGTVVNSFGGKTGVITVGNGLTMGSGASEKEVSARVNGYIVNNAGTGTNALDIDSSKVDSNYTTTNTTNLATVATVTAGLATLDVNEYAQASVANDGMSFTVKGINEIDGKIAAGTTAANDLTLAFENAYDATDSKIATKTTVTNAINDLDVNEYTQGSVSTSSLTIKGIKEVDGKISVGTDTTKDVVVNFDGSYDGTNNKVATVSTVTGAIADLDTTNDVSLWTGAAYTPGTGENATYAYTVKKVAEENGIVKAGTDTDSTLYLKRAQSATNPIVTMDDLSGVTGAMVYRDSVTYNNNAWSFGSTTPTSVDKGDVYVVSTGFTLDSATALLGHNIPAGTYEAGDMFIYNGSAWTTINGENQVTNNAATIAVGADSFTTLATVDGTAITAKVSAAADKVTTAAITDGAATNPSTLYAASNVQTVLEDVARKSNSALQSVSGTVDYSTPTGQGTAYRNEYSFIKTAPKDSNNDQGISAWLTLAELSNTWGEQSGSQYVSAARHGLLTDADVAIMKNYIDWKAPDAATAAVNALDATADADTASGTGYATITTTTPSADFKVLNSITETDGKLASGDAYQLKKVAATGEAADMSVIYSVYGGGSATSDLQTALTNLSSAITNANITIDGHKGAITTGNGLTDVANDGGSFGINIDTTNAHGLYLEGSTEGSKTLAMHIADESTASGANFGTVKVTNGNGLSISSGVVSYAHNTTAITVASESNGVVTINGTLTPDASDTITGSNTITLAKVATTGKAEDVDITDSGSLITATTVEGALQEIAAEIDAMDAVADSTKTAIDGSTARTAQNGGVFALQAITETDGKITAMTAVEVEAAGTTATAIAGLDASVSTYTEASNVITYNQGSNVAVDVTEADGKLTAVSAMLYWDMYE